MNSGCPALLCPAGYLSSSPLSMSVALKEFCPEKILLLGPGNSLGGAIGQIIVEHGWNGIHSKNDFIMQQGKDPFLISMGLEEQRKLI